MKILVSACLLGSPVRYDGSSKTLAHSLLDLWGREGRLVPICPELAAGFPVPRPPAEIAGEGRVLEADGRDVTALYLAGAEAALALAREHGCAFALLTDASPSCGSASIYDGTFQGRRQSGEGVTTALLRRNGIEVFSETQVELLRERLSR